MMANAILIARPTLGSSRKRENVLPNTSQAVFTTAATKANAMNFKNVSSKRCSGVIEYPAYTAPIAA